jgi:hypothetical protein
VVPTKKTRTAHNDVGRFHNIPEKSYRRPYKRSDVRQFTPKRGTPETELVGTGFNRVYRAARARYTKVI